MSVATLFSPINDSFSLEEFAFANQTEHTNIVARLYQVFNLVLPDYPLVPIPADIDNWSQMHQQSHNDFSRILGTSNFDFSEVDFKDPKATEYFVQLHGQAHREISDLLRIGIDY